MAMTSNVPYRDGPMNRVGERFEAGVGRLNVREDSVGEAHGLERPHGKRTEVWVHATELVGLVCVLICAVWRGWGMQWRGTYKPLRLSRRDVSCRGRAETPPDAGGILWLGARP
jgi:hypothetical protein